MINCLPDLEGTRAHASYVGDWLPRHAGEGVLVALHTEPIGGRQRRRLRTRIPRRAPPGSRRIEPSSSSGGQSAPVEKFTVDDHPGLVEVPRVGSLPAGGGAEAGGAALRRMEEVFQASLCGYASVEGLHFNEAKTHWAEPEVVALGAEIDDPRGRVGSRLSRRQALAWATLDKGSVRQALLRQRMGLWMYAACFARPALALFDGVPVGEGRGAARRCVRGTAKMPLAQEAAHQLAGATYAALVGKPRLGERGSPSALQLRHRLVVDGRNGKQRPLGVTRAQLGMATAAWPDSVWAGEIGRALCPLETQSGGCAVPRPVAAGTNGSLAPLAASPPTGRESVRPMGDGSLLQTSQFLGRAVSEAALGERQAEEGGEGVGAAL